jgi:hypothetical protein
LPTDVRQHASSRRIRTLRLRTLRVITNLRSRRRTDAAALRFGVRRLHDARRLAGPALRFGPDHFDTTVIAPHGTLDAVGSPIVDRAHHLLTRARLCTPVRTANALAATTVTLPGGDARPAVDAPDCIALVHFAGAPAGLAEREARARPAIVTPAPARAIVTEAHADARVREARTAHPDERVITPAVTRHRPVPGCPHHDRPVYDGSVPVRPEERIIPEGIVP